jgi:hypothetical protein
MRRWRSKRHRSTTTFHPDASSIMHDLLPLLEEWKRTGGTSGSMLDQEEEASAGARSGVGRRGRRPSIDTGPLYVQGETGGAVQILQVDINICINVCKLIVYLHPAPQNSAYTWPYSICLFLGYSTGPYENDSPDPVPTGLSAQHAIHGCRGYPRKGETFFIYELSYAHIYMCIFIYRCIYSSIDVWQNISKGNFCSSPWSLNSVSNICARFSAKCLSASREHFRAPPQNGV